MRLGLISDVHFGPDARHAGKLRKLSHCAKELTLGFVDSMAAAHPDLVVNLGDVIEDENPEVDRARYEQFVELLQRIDTELVHVAGNHDSVHITDAELAVMWGHSGELYFSRDVMGWHLVVLRSVERTNQDIRLPDDQLTWLAEDLARNTAPALLFVHHPLSEMDLTGNRWFEDRPHLCRVANRREVRALIEQTGNVRAVFNGHAHWTHCDVISGIPYVTLQSLIENVDDDAPGRAAAAHALVEATATRIHVRVAGQHPVALQFEYPRQARRHTP